MQSAHDRDADASPSHHRDRDKSYPHTPDNANDSSNEDAKKYSRGTGKRNRVHFACTECYRRKQKCNRETPCQHCIARKIPERCKTFQPGEESNDVASRLNRVERLLDDYLPRLVHQLDRLSSASATATATGSASASAAAVPPRSKSRASWTDAQYAASPASINDHDEPRSHSSSSRLHASARRHADPTAAAAAAAAESSYSSSYAHGATAKPSSVTDDDDDDELDELEPDGRLSPKTGFYNGGSMDMRISSLLDGLPGSSSKTPVDAPVRTLIGTLESLPDLDHVMAEFGCPTAPTPDLLGALISRSHCNVLLSHYFDRINWMRQPLPQKALRQSFENFWNSGPKFSAQNINIFALLCNLCAIATLSVEHHLFPHGPRDRLKVARRYHYAGRRALLMSSIMGREDVDQVVAWVASCRFLLLDRRIGEAYTLGSSAVRAAFSIGLHRDGTKLGLSPGETEARRRVWASVYFLDRALAINTGRPAVIDDRLCDTQEPSSVMDEDVFPVPRQPPRMPDGVEPPTAYSYTVYRQRIAQLEGKILTTFQSLQHPVHVSDVLALDQHICELQDNLPFFFRARLTKNGVECDKSLDSTYGFLNVHRFLLHTEINSVRIALHRPYLLRSGGSHGARFMPCRQASLNAALHDLELRSDFVKDLRASLPDKDGGPLLLYRVQIGTYKWFHSLLVCGIAMLMDPWAATTPKLRSHLQHYVDTYARRSAQEKDEMRDREANVIGLFLSKLEQVQKLGPAASIQAGRSTGAGRQPKRGRSIDGAHNADLGRDSKAVRHHERSSSAKHEDVNPDERTDAHLLLGLGQQPGKSTASGTAEAASSSSASSSSAAAAAAAAAASAAKGGGFGSPSTASRSVPNSSLTYSNLSGSTRSPRHSATPGSSSARGPPPRSGSGDWPRGIASGIGGGVQASPGGTNSSSNSPNTTSTSGALAGSSNQVGGSEGQVTASSTPPFATTSGRNNGGDDAQQIFDTWYQAEWAAASMPSYDAAYNGLGGVSNAQGGGNATAGASLGLEGLGGLGGFLGTGTSSGGMGGGFNGMSAFALAGFGNNGGSGGVSANQTGVSGASGGGYGGWSSQGLQPTTTASSFSAATNASGSIAPSQQQHQQQQSGGGYGSAGGGGDTGLAQSGHISGHGNMPSASTSLLAHSTGKARWQNPSTGVVSDILGPSQPGTAPAHIPSTPTPNANFDPTFWQTLIDKIIT
ncbi:hypothetical protein BCV70DRAFT_202338 [Testicularia cyperi]|uniref:Zn(2)-C6 fungal-type domain-containing protein n=1 Tax=Testicularia cyperi TaxID=1882483 RepID=A0A317XLI3_9BASI|nr:hypothetical protein BCV70DRAFT_202338 [Testicularia cyperi]